LVATLAPQPNTVEPDPNQPRAAAEKIAQPDKEPFRLPFPLTVLGFDVFFSLVLLKNLKNDLRFEDQEKILSLRDHLISAIKSDELDENIFEINTADKVSLKASQQLGFNNPSQITGKELLEKVLELTHSRLVENELPGKLYPDLFNALLIPIFNALIKKEKSDILEKMLGKYNLDLNNGLTLYLFSLLTASYKAGLTKQNDNSLISFDDLVKLSLNSKEEKFPMLHALLTNAGSSAIIGNSGLDVNTET
jgi:hypothetical protein